MAQNTCCRLGPVTHEHFSKSTSSCTGSKKRCHGETSPSEKWVLYWQEHNRQAHDTWSQHCTTTSSVSHCNSSSGDCFSERTKRKQRQTRVQGALHRRHHNKMSCCHDIFFPDIESWGTGGRGSWRAPMAKSPHLAHMQNTCGPFPLALVWDAGR